MTVQTIETAELLRDQLADWRASEEHIALVPTMGNLHQGHVSLIELAREHAEKVVVSIFVNPTQFGQSEDFDDYPRTMDRDTRRANRAGADLIFAPSVETMYPYGLDGATSITVPIISEEFCGSFRPGHFDGVSSVVSRLFSLVQPDAAIFGQKDYQQQLVIRRLVRDLNLPIRIVTAETIREDDGLAMSSRNQYLTEQDREIAPQLYKVLQATGKKLQAGQREFSELEATALERLRQAGFEPDYVGIRRAEDLSVPDRDCDELVVLAAANLGNTRLIDNIVITV